MERVEHFLSSGEQVVLSSRQHPVVLFKPALTWLATMAVMALAGTFVTARIDDAWAGRAVAAVVLAATAYLIVRTLQWWATRYVITEERVILLSGVLSVRVSSVPFSKVNDTTFSRSLWGRLLGFGNLQLESAGERTGLSSLRYLPRPKEIYRLLASLLAERDRQQPVLPQRPRWTQARVPGQDDTGPLPRVG